MNVRAIRKIFQKSLKSILPVRYIAWTGWKDGSLINSEKPNYIRCTLQDGTPVEAWNDGVPAVANIQVRLHTDDGYPGLLIAQKPRLAFSQDFPFVSVSFHRENHTWPGPDTVSVEVRQIMPLQPYSSGLIVTVRPGWIELSSGLALFAEASVDLSAQRPADGARYVLLSIDADGSLAVTSGDVASRVELDLADIPAVPANHVCRIAAVRLYTGQSRIEDVKYDTDLVDLRFTPSGNPGSGSGEGDMLKSVYDTNNDGVVDSADEVDGVATAGNSKYYGTSGSGTPGFHTLPSGGDQVFPQRDIAYINQFRIVSGCGGSLIFGPTSNAFFQIAAYQSTPGNGDAIETTVLLAAGTYDVSVHMQPSESRGKLDWSLDGTNFITGQDWYSGASIKTGTVTIANSGRHLVRATVNGKNALATNFYFDLAYIAFIAQSQTAET